MSWNVNGVRAAEKKGFLDWLAEAGPEVLCLQEIKALPEQLSDELREPAGYHAAWHPAERKGYSGVAILSRRAPDRVVEGMGIPEYDCEGRTLRADFGELSVITSYTPNGGSEHARVPYKMGYKAALLGYSERLRGQGRSVLLCGDLNTAHREIDLARPKQNQKTTGFLPVERTWFDGALGLGWLDTYRAVHGDVEGAYSWWSLRSGARARNVGWRLDYCLTSPDLAERLEAAEIHTEVMGSDHCPVSVTIRDA